MRPAPVFVGIDVSKLMLDVAVHPTGDVWRVPNEAAGIADLVDRLGCMRLTTIVFRDEARALTAASEKEMLR